MGRFGVSCPVPTVYPSLPMLITRLGLKYRQHQFIRAALLFQTRNQRAMNEAKDGGVTNNHSREKHPTNDIHKRDDPEGL